jgi:hypothetical protein
MSIDAAVTTPPRPALLPGPNRGWLLAFVGAGVLSFVASSVPSHAFARSFVSGAAFIVQLVAFLKVSSFRPGRTGP